MVAEEFRAPSDRLKQLLEKHTADTFFTARRNKHGETFKIYCDESEGEAERIWKQPDSSEALAPAKGEKNLTVVEAGWQFFQVPPQYKAEASAYRLRGVLSIYN